MKYKLLFLSIIGILLASCSHNDYRKAEGAAWGTTYRIVYKSDKDLSDSVIAEMRKVELSLSMFDKSSTVSKINARLTDRVDPYLKAVLATSLRVNKASRGAFDPTVAPLVDLWGFGRNGREGELPDSSAVEATLAKVGLTKLKISGESIEMPEGMELDFSSIAKGFGVDCVAAMLTRNGCTDFMVEIGGEVSVSGVNTYGEKWRIMIEAPTEAIQRTAEPYVLEISDCAVATSGNYRNNRPVSPDSAIGHTIDPLTGYPKISSVLSATVVAPSCVLADALATAVMASELEMAENIIVQFPSTRAIIYIKNDSTYRVDILPTVQ